MNTLNFELCTSKFSGLGPDYFWQFFSGWGGGYPGFPESREGVVIQRESYGNQGEHAVPNIFKNVDCELRHFQLFIVGVTTPSTIPLFPLHTII